MTKKYKTVGHNVDKIDGYSLVTGKAQYVDDIDLQNMLHIKLKTSPHAHAIIKDIDTSEAEKLEGVELILTYKNVPRVPYTTAGQGYPEPSPYDTYSFDNKVRYVGDRVAAVVAESEKIAEKALSLITVEYEVLPFVLCPKEALKEGAPVIHDEDDCSYPISIPYEPKQNICAKIDMEIGSFSEVYKKSAFTVDREFYAHNAQHCALEPHACIGYLDEQDRLVLRVATQVPFHSRRIVAKLTKLPIRKIRVIKPRIGGGFGGKQEIILEDLVAFAVLQTRRPVRWVFTREEEFLYSRTRHSQYVNIRLGANKEGKLEAMEMRVISNTGAYGAHALTVLGNCGNKVLPIYRCDNIVFHGKAVYTNLPIAGAYRGYGATQAAFAMECAITDLAHKVGIDPLEFRKNNHIQKGGTSPVFEKMGEGSEGVAQSVDSCELEACIEWGKQKIEWGKKPSSSLFKKRGKGMAILMQGSSIPRVDMGAAYMKMNEDGSFNLHVGATDVGTGSDTVLAQIAAEVLEISEKDIIVYSSDTDFTPFDVGAYASSTTYLSGNAVRKTALKMKDAILKAAISQNIFQESHTENLFLEDGYVIEKQTGKKMSFSEICTTAMYTENQHQIAASDSFVAQQAPPPFAAHFAEVEVDTLTGKVEVINYVASVDCGTAIHPRLANGQTRGAVANGISFALTEEYIINSKGKMLNPNFDNYKIYSSVDMPNLLVHLVESYEDTGPFGAKSIGEISLNGPLPAISNAIYDAVGVRMSSAPFTSEKVYWAMKNNALNDL